MSAVVISVVEGDRVCRELTFEEHSGMWVVGRGSDCDVRLPNDLAHGSVSRHHCRLDVAPPCVWVSDLDSLNGTYVNGVRIGGRPTDEGGLRPRFRYLLEDGDEVRVGDTVLRVAVHETIDVGPAGEAALACVA
jgi:pSer/pThr/pTyr-binding forkhead associated (FHA) protein